MLSQQILLFLKGLAGTVILSPTSVTTNSSVANSAAKKGEVEGNDGLFCPLFGVVMTKNEHDMLNKFQKISLRYF